MSIETLLDRYTLHVTAEGYSPRSVSHAVRCVGFFDQFMGGIEDVRHVSGDDLRQFILALQKGQMGWYGPVQRKATQPDEH